MAISKCGSCENTSFELKTQEPRGSAVKMNFIQCSKCGAVAGIAEYVSISASVVNIAESIEKMDKRVQGLESHLHRIDSALAQVSRRPLT